MTATDLALLVGAALPAGLAVWLCVPPVPHRRALRLRARPAAGRGGAPYPRGVTGAGATGAGATGAGPTAGGGEASRRRGAPLRHELPADLLFDLVAAAVDAGVPPPVALHAVADAVAATAGVGAGAGAGANASAEALRRMASGGPAGVGELAGLQAVLERSARAGLAPSTLLRRSADEARRDAQARTAEAVGRLPVRMVLPAGLCLLPAALLLGVVPVVLDLVAQVVG